MNFPATNTRLLPSEPLPWLFGSGPDGEFLTPGLCNSEPCRNMGREFCELCHLVQYCSDKCRVAHLNKHRQDCNNPIAGEDWAPGYVEEKRKIAEDEPCYDYKWRYMWGNVPGYDLLKLATHEGVDHGEKSLCFAASGDIRNVMETVVGIPHEFKQKCEIVINDKDSNVVMRNTIILLLAFTFPNGEASELIVHLWYSASLPAPMWRVATETVIPLIKDFVNEIKEKPDSAPFTKLWTFGISSLRLTMERKKWEILLDMVDPKSPPILALREQSRKAAMRGPGSQYWQDKYQQSLFRLPRFSRLVEMRYIETGVLMPFGSTSTRFDTTNPTLFTPSGHWIMDHQPTFDLHSGCHPAQLLEIRETLHLPCNDHYGILFFQRREMAEAFCRRLVATPLHFCMYNTDARELGRFYDDFSFDRIDVSNIADICFLGIRRTLLACSPLLKNPKQNPCATLLTSFVEALQHSWLETKWPALEVSHETFQSMEKLVPRRSSTNPRTLMEVQLLENICEFFFLNVGELLERYEEEEQFNKARLVGLEQKGENTIVEKWPLRIETAQSFEEVKRKFELFRSSGCSAHLTFIEWKHTETFMEDELPNDEDLRLLWSNYNDR